MFAYDEGWSRRINEAIDSGLTAEAAIERVQQRTRARMILAGIFLDRLKTLETCASAEIDFATAAGTPAFDWRNGSRRSF